MKIKSSSMSEVWWNVYCLINLYILVEAILSFFYITAYFYLNLTAEWIFNSFFIFCMESVY